MKVVYIADICMWSDEFHSYLFQLHDFKEGSINITAIKVMADHRIIESDPAHALFFYHVSPRSLLLSLYMSLYA